MLKKQPSPATSVSVPQPRGGKLPTLLLKRPRWTAVSTVLKIAEAKGDLENTTCRLCQQIFTTPHLKVHMPQHCITTFCPCGEYSCNRDYILRHQRTMNCHVGHLFDVDEPTFPEFSNVIRLLVKDLPVCLTRSPPLGPSLRGHYQGPRQGKTSKPAAISLPLHSPRMMLW